MRMREAPAAFADETPVAQAAIVPDTTNIPLAAAAVAVSSTPDELSAAPTAEPEANAIVVQAKELLPERSGHRAGARMRPDHCRLEAESVPLRPVMRIRRGRGGRDGLVEDMRAEWGELDRRIEAFDAPVRPRPSSDDTGGAAAWSDPTDAAACGENIPIGFLE